MIPPDPATARVRFGPVLANPALSLTNAGVDTNVFNESDADNPKRDITLTLTPQSELWLRMGRTWVSGTIKKELVWYKKYTSQRSSNDTYSIGWLVPLTRITFGIAGTWVNTHERPGFEIDTRAPRTERGISGAVELRTVARMMVGVRGEQRRVKFDEGTTFLGANLRDELDRTQTTVGTTFRYELTPLTSFIADASRVQDRFEFTGLRDSNSTHVSVGLRFDPFALIKGSGQLGIRDFNPLSPDVPGFRGLTAAANLSYVFRGSTRFGVQVTRDVQYSHDVVQPYYLQTGVQASIAQQIFGPVDIEGRIGTQRLSYRDRAGAVIEASNRTDRAGSRGVGIGYRVGRDLRVGFNVEWNKRDSVLERRQYHGMRYGTTITYGL